MVRASAGARPFPSAFLHARLVGLFLLSTGAIYGAYLGWQPAQLARIGPLAWPPLAVGLAVVAGAVLHDRLSSLSDRAGRWKLRAAAGVGYGGVLLLVLLGILVGEPKAVASGLTLLMILQPAFLLLAGLGRGCLGALVNALALTMVGALGGGERASAAVASHAAFLAFFLVADHAARKLAEYPVESLPAPRALLGQAFLPALAAAGALVLLFAWIPPQPYAPLKRTGGAPAMPPEDLARILLELGGILALATLGFYLALRFGSGGSGERGDPVAEKVPARVRSEPSGPSRGPGDGDGDSGWRGRIVRLYVRLLGELARLGVRRRPDQTPLEYARKLAPEGAAGELTGVFMRARYGGEEPGETEYRSAQAAAQAVLDRARKGT